jgi:hypothetical protein|tara:strand:+ start:689 stop:1021 length:333 start_codon:yes stop_codon:yes gene_type:complete
MKISTKLLILFLTCTMTNVGLAVYYFKSNKKETKAEKPVSTTGYNPAPLLAGLEQINRQAIFRDTVILKHVLRTQHHLKMHVEQVPMCPDCINNDAKTKFVSNFTRRKTP